MTRRLCLFFTVLLFVAPALSLRATENVNAVSITVTPGTSTTSDGYTYENGVRSLTGFATPTSSYAVASEANNVFVRRNSTNLNQSSVWYASSGTGTNLSGVHQNAYGPMLLGNTLFSGSDNTFANSPNGATVGNIERLDFTWNAGLIVSDSLAFAVFERGVAAAHDGFGIAAVTAIDSAGNPTAFGSLLKVATGWGGATNPVADQNYRLFRYANGDSLTANTASTEVATQGVGGVVVRASDLGLTVGTKIYGYALMGADVTATNSTQLTDWLNSTYYPTTTDGATGGGGIDLASFNGFEITAVPEPGTLPALLVIGMLIAHSSYRRARRTPAA